jgi:TPR repeat protein
MNKPKVTSSEESEYVRAFFEARKADFTYENGMVRAQGRLKKVQEKADEGNRVCADEIGLEFYHEYIVNHLHRNEPGVRPVMQIFRDAAIHYLRIAGPYSEDAYRWLLQIIEENFEELCGDNLFEIVSSMRGDNEGNRNYLLGKICLFKDVSDHTSYKSGLNHLLRSESRGNVAAMMLLGKIYEEGYSRAGIQALGQDYGIAYRYYKKAPRMVLVQRN